MLILIIGDTRVGSTALGHAISKPGMIHYLGEIFHPRTDTGSGIFYNKLSRFTIDKLADRNSFKKIMDRQISDLISKESVSHLIFDIKYHDLNFIPTHPSRLNSSPNLLDYFINRDDTLILHINRKNKIPCIISEYIANITKDHHIFKDDKVVSEKSTMHTINIEEYNVVSELLDREECFERVREWLNASHNCIDLDYEAVFLSKNGANILSTIIKDELNIEDFHINLTTKRASKYYSTIIGNADSLRSVFLGSKWELYLEEILEKKYYDIIE